MINATELFIEGQKVNVSETLSSIISYAIDDIKHFGFKDTSFSKTIVLPGTKINDKTFGHIYEITSSNVYDPAKPNIGTNFNAAKGAAAILKQDGFQVFKGVMKLTGIVTTKGKREYEVELVGELGGFILALGNKKLQDLDFSTYNQTYSIANIAASWDNAGGSGVYFPLTNYGNYSANKHDWKYGTFRPALYIKEYWDKIFEGSGYKYDCPLVDTDRFKTLAVPHNQKQFVKRSENGIDVSKPSTTTFTEADGYNIAFKVPLPTIATIGNFTANGSNTEYTYTPSASVSGKIYATISGTYTKTNPSINLAVQIDLNGSPVNFGFGTSMIFGAGNVGGSFDSVNSLLSILTGSLTINQNDVLSVSVAYLGDSSTGNFSVNIDQCHLYYKLDANSVVPIGLGETITVNDSIPQNILQKDLIVTIIKLFNLYVDEDKFESKKLNIKPYPDYYDTDPSHAIDWSYKLDRSKTTTLRPLSQINARYYEFKFKSDADYYNDLYTKRYNQNYGDLTYDSAYEFAKESEKVEVIFSGTILEGVTGEDKVWSAIYKKNGTNEENIDSNIRILQTKKVTGVTSWNILDDDGTTVLGSYTSYGYAGHLDDPDVPSNDIHFGVPKELFFALATGNLSVNQFNVYYSPYMAEITDKDSKMFIGEFRLTAKDIYNLNFSKLIYLDEVKWRLNKIANYNASTPSTCKCELLKVNYLSY